MSWIGVWLGLSVPTVEVAQQVVVHRSSSRSRSSRTRSCRSQRCRRWLQPFAEWNPISTLDRLAARRCGATRTRSTGESLASTEPILVTLVWFAIILAIFAPLGVRRYRIDEPLSRTAGCR